MSAVRSPRERQADAYARLRAIEGRGAGGADELFALPYLTDGPLARQWAVRARTYEALLSEVVAPLEAGRRRPGLPDRPLLAADLGAGNGWLAGHLALRGHRAVALDLRCDRVDGLAAGSPYARRLPTLFGRVAGSFEAAPLRASVFDLVLFDASIHYAASLERATAEAARLAAPGGVIAILDSPFYAHEADGERMVTEKRRATRSRFGDLADALLALPAIEYLTRERLEAAAEPHGLTFRRRRVRYPFWYEWRPVPAFLTRSRPPSRFDLWTARVP